MGDLTNLSKRRYLIKIDPTLSKGDKGDPGDDATIEDFLPLNTSDSIHDGAESNGSNLRDLIDQLLFQILVIGELTSQTGATFEKGITIDSLTLSWSLNKIPLSQTLSASNLDPITLNPTDVMAGVTFTPENIVDFTITLMVTDLEGTKQVTLDIIFINKIYYGVSTVPGSYNDAFLLSLPINNLQSNRLLTTSFTTGNNQYFYVALPSAYGTPIFLAGGFTADMTLVATFDHTNASGHIEEYKVWATTYDNLGTVSFEIE
jgi:hypothetical protein